MTCLALLTITSSSTLSCCPAHSKQLHGPETHCHPPPPPPPPRPQLYVQHKPLCSLLQTLLGVLGCKAPPSVIPAHLRTNPSQAPRPHTPNSLPGFVFLALKILPSL